MNIKLINSELFGDGDGQAINRHSWREYKVEGAEGFRFYLDKNLSASPCFYELYLFGPLDGLPRCVPNLLHGGMSWPKAKAEAFRAIEAYVNDNNLLGEAQ